MKRIILTLALATLTSAALAQFNLANYQLSATVNLVTPVNFEASGVTYNWDNGRLYVVEDEGLIMFEYDKTGTLLSTMTLQNAGTDVEGITYIGGGQFLAAEERIQDVYRFSYTAGGTLNRAGLPTFSVGPTVGNVGLEGISYDPVNGVVLGVKEKTPQAIYTMNLDFPSMTGTVTSFTPSLGLLDLSDVQALATVPGLVGTGDQDNLLVYSQESAKLLEISRTGTILSQFDFTGLSTAAEGVTIDENGVIYIVSEDPKLFILTPIVPEPSALALFAVGGGILAVLRRRK